jgi:hypothetical protein
MRVTAARRSLGRVRIESGPVYGTNACSRFRLQYKSLGRIGEYDLIVRNVSMLSNTHHFSPWGRCLDTTGLRHSAHSSSTTSCPAACRGSCLFGVQTTCARPWWEERRGVIVEAENCLLCCCDSERTITRRPKKAISQRQARHGSISSFCQDRDPVSRAVFM